MTDLLDLTHAERIERARPEELEDYEWHVMGELRYAPLKDRNSGTRTWLYQPAGGVLTVDGITYRSRDAYCQNPMIALLEDHECRSSTETPSNPPTEAELDLWVRTGVGRVGE